MKILKIAKHEMDLFAAVLPTFGEVYAPVKRGAGYAFERPALWSDVQLSYPRTILPPKKFMLPAKECLFTFNDKDGYYDHLAEAEKKIVLLGVHAYDIFGLNILDRVFAGGKYSDPYFVKRRQNTTIIGVDFEPDDMHFALSMNANFVDSGFDLFLSDIGNDYLVLVGSSRGDDIALQSGCLFETPSPADYAEYKHRSGLRNKSYRTHVDLGDLPEILEIEYASKVWDELGRKCLSCGACSMVCPTCYCFDVADEVDLGSRSGRRHRLWDSCLFETHALVAGGENFREHRSSRIKFRYYHKQRGFVAEYGRPSCVGCGRCIAGCPAKIDIVSVIEKLRGEKNATGSAEPPAKGR